MIYHDIFESNYWVDYDRLDLFFSSKKYKEMFIDKVDDFVKYEKIKFFNKYKIDVDKLIRNDNELTLNELFAISLYNRIEKRGFRVYKGDKLIEL